MSVPILLGSTTPETVVIITDTAGLRKTDVVWNTASLALWYRLDGGSKVDITTATLATVNAAYSSGGFIHIADGEYRLCLPSAAAASGTQVTVGGSVPSGVVFGYRQSLVGINPTATVAPADVTKWNGTSVATPATAGYPVVTLKVGTGTGEVEVSSGIVKANLWSIIGTVLTETTSGWLTAAFRKLFNVATPALTAESVNQTGDSFARLGAPAVSVSADIAAAKAVLDGLDTRLTAARAGYLDYLNVGGQVASQADINALNQSASRRTILTTLAQWERPESGNFTKLIEVRTWDGDGVPADADATPVIAITGTTSGSLAANLSTVSHPSTGTYRWTYTGTSADVLEDVEITVTPTIGGTAFPVTALTEIRDNVSATWTAGDRTKLVAVFDKLPSRTYLAGTDQATGAIASADKTGMFISGTKTTLDDLNDIDSTAVQAAANAALAANHLDHLLAVAYDPTAKPGHAAALLNAIVQNDGGVPQATANFLELAPSGGGGGGDATLANQTAMLKLLQADMVVDTESTPYRLLFKEAGTETVLLTKELKQIDGSNVTAITHRIAQQVAP